MVYKVLSLILVVTYVLTGCANAPAVSSPTAVVQTTTSAEQAKPTAEQPLPSPAGATPAARAVSAPSGTLVAAVSSFGEDILDPLLGGAANNPAIVDEMFETLTADDGKGNQVPQLAESWSVSPDGKTWTFQIRKGVKFHDGDDLTSTDVKFSIERLLSPKSRNASTPNLRAVVDHVDAPDPYTVKVTTKDVNAILLDLGLGQIMPKKYIEEKGEDYFGQHPVGTGPWKFVSHTPGSSVEYEAVNDHWRITPAFQHLIVKQVPEESTRIAMLERGDADIIDISLDSLDSLKAAGLETRTGTYESSPAIYLPGTWLTDGPTSDIRIRQALTLAINRDELAKTFFKGFATPATRLKMGTYSWGYDSSWQPEPYDPQKAKQLLADAGYPTKFKDPVVTLWSFQMPGANWLPQYAQIISGYWEAISVKTKITPIDFGTFRSMYMARPVDPKIIGTAYPNYQGNQANALNSINNAYGSKGIAPIMQNPGWDDLYLQVLKEVDENKRMELTRQLMNLGYSQYVSLMTVNIKDVYGVSNKVGDWGPLVGELGRTYETIRHK